MRMTLRMKFSYMVHSMIGQYAEGAQKRVLRYIHSYS